MKNINLFGIPFVSEEWVETMPYMGSKRKLSNKILNAIYQTIGDFENFYDLFGGGGALSVASLKAGHKTHYNELNAGIVNLMKYIRDGGKLPTNWVSREEFNKYKDGNDWYAGFVKCVWSFGNGQKSYLYGKEVEEYKQNYHLVVFENQNKLKEMQFFINNYFLENYNLQIDFKLKMPTSEKRHNRKLEIRQQINKLENLTKQELSGIQTLQSLESLESLERLQSLESLERLEITNLSYEQVEIKNNSVIYCDIPYKDTREYQNTLDYDKFYKWALKNPNPVFVSSYEMPIEFKEVASFEHRTTLSATNNSKIVFEKLFWNRKQVLL